jgi:hypothetical protein
MIAANKVVPVEVQEEKPIEELIEEEPVEVHEEEPVEVHEEKPVEVRDVDCYVPLPKKASECPEITFQFPSFSEYFKKFICSPGTASKLLNETYNEMCEKMKKLINNDQIFENISSENNLKTIAINSYNTNTFVYVISTGVYNNLYEKIETNKSYPEISEYYRYLILKHIIAHEMQEDLYNYIESVFDDEIAGKLTGMIYESFRDIFLDSNIEKANSCIEKKIKETYILYKKSISGHKPY